MRQNIKPYHACLLLPVSMLQQNVSLPFIIFISQLYLCIDKDDIEIHILHLLGDVLGDFWIELKAFYDVF